VIDKLNEALAHHIFPPREDGSEPRSCPSCKEGVLSIRLGKFGAFIGCSRHPECKFTRPLAQSDEEAQTTQDKDLGVDPATGETVFLKNGRFGVYVQLGEGEKPKRSGLPKGWAADEMDLPRALKLLSLPREVGPHPEDLSMILAGLGRYGPYVQWTKMYASLPGVDDAFEIGLNRAVALLEEKKSGAGGGRFQRGAAVKALKELGESPVTGKVVKIMPGKWGAYVSDGVTNATLPKDKDPASFSLDEALPLLAKKAEAGPSKKPARKAKAEPAAKAAKPAKSVAKEKPAKKAPAKKPAAKKAPAKKTAKG
jgi:DNA topoisomerase-1